MKVYCFYTPSHSIFFEEWFLPSASKEYEVVPAKHVSQISKTGSYAKQGWRETQYNKVLAWKKAVEDNMGDVILCCDVDIQFLGKSKEYLSKILVENDIGFQQNAKGGNICSGFFVCRCSLRTQNFFDIISKRLKKIMHEDGGGEQYEYWKLLNEPWYDLNIQKLSHDRIWTPGKNYEDLTELNVPEEIMVHHANWTHGVDNKVKQLEYVQSVFLQRNAPWSRLKSPNLNTPKVRDAPKIAICSSSLLRNFDVHYYSLVSRVISTLPCKPDYIGHFPTQSKKDVNLNTLKNLESFCDTVHVKFEKDPPIHQSYMEMTNNMAIQRNGLKGNIYQWISMKKCAQLLEKVEKKNGHQYDWVIWLRPDLHFYNSLDNVLNLDNSYFYASAHDNHLQGMYDRFCLGNSNAIQERMHILDYFSKEWYPKYNDDENVLTWNPYRKKYVWNPELCLRYYIQDELKLPNKKLNLCSGKIRDRFYATVPFWYSVYGTERTGYKCENDIVNHEVLNRIKTFDAYQMYEGSPWHAVNILNDTVLLNHPERISELSNAEIIESKLSSMSPPQPKKLGFLEKLAKKLDEKKLKEETKNGDS